MTTVFNVARANVSAWLIIIIVPSFKLMTGYKLYIVLKSTNECVVEMAGKI